MLLWLCRRRLIQARARTRMQQQQWLDTAQPSAGRDQPFAAHAGAREGDVQLQAASGRGSGSGSGGAAHLHARHSVITDLVSALVASVATSVIEGPLELFLNRARVRAPSRHVPSCCLHLTARHEEPRNG